MKECVVILGAGLTGLGAAWELAGKGPEVHVVEVEPEVGGLAGSFSKDGYVFDYGPHSFYSKDEEVFDKVKALLGDDLRTLGPMYGDIKIIFQGREYDYPLRVQSTLANMPLPVVLRCAFDFFQANLKRKFTHPPLLTFEDWVTGHFGRGLYNLFFGPFTQKTWGVSPSELAASFASERIPTLSIRRLIQDAFKRQAGNQATATPPGKFYNPLYSYYPKRGNAQIAAGIRTEIESKGARLHLGSQIEEVRCGSDLKTRVVFREAGVRTDVTCDFVISTIPIPELARVVQPLDPEARRAGLALRYRELTLLYLQVRKPKVFGGRLVYFHDPEIIFQRGSEMKGWSNAVVPSDDRSGLILEITNRDRLPDHELYRQSVSSLERLGLLRESDIEGHHIARKSHAYPIYDVDYNEKLLRFKKGLPQAGRLILCGRQGLFRYIDMYHCLRMGMTAARYTLGQGSLESLESTVAHWSKPSKP